MTRIRLDKIISYSGYQGEESPRVFFINDEEITVVEILEMWREETLHDRGRKRFFRVKGSNEILYTLCHEEASSEWFYEK